MWPPTLRARAQTKVNAPIDFAFDYFNNNIDAWRHATPEIKSFDVDPPGEIAEGSFIVLRIEAFGRQVDFELLVTDFRAPTLIAFEGINDGIHTREIRSFATEAGVTSIDSRFEYTPRTLGGWTTFLFFLWWLQPLYGTPKARRALNSIAADCERACKASTTRRT